MLRIVFPVSVLATVSVCQDTFPGSELGPILNGTTGLELNSPRETLGGLDAFIRSLRLSQSTIRTIIRVESSVDIENLVRENQVSVDLLNLTELPCQIAYSCIVIFVCVTLLALHAIAAMHMKILLPFLLESHIKKQSRHTLLHTDIAGEGWLSETKMGN